MKLKIKGLVFVGFAAAVFASAANAADKVVTSKTYVDNKYIAGTGITMAENDQGKKVISTTADLTPYTGSDGVTLTGHNFTNSGVREVTASDATTGTDGTITVNTNGTSAEVAVKNVEVTSRKVQTVDGNSATASTDYPSVAAVANLVGQAYTGTDGIDVNTSTHVITNAGVRSVAAGSALGELTVNTNGTPATVTVPGLGTAAGKTADTAISTTAAENSDAEVPTSKAVYEFVGTQAVANQADWAEIDNTKPSYINNKPTLATVATSGSYNDLANQPTIGNATLTITDGTTTLGTFTANATDAVSITVPNVAGTIPQATNCSAEAPCALVATGATTFAWEPIAQQ